MTVSVGAEPEPLNCVGATLDPNVIHLAYGEAYQKMRLAEPVIVLLPKMLRSSVEIGVIEFHLFL